MPAHPFHSLSRRFGSLIFIVATLLSLTIVQQSVANQCETSACPKGFTYNASRHSCVSRSGLGYQSHTPPRCAVGSTLDLKRGVCHKRNCISCEKRACRPGETYRKGLCHHQSGLGYRSHYRPNCGAGWHLVVARGVCRKNICTRIHPLPRPYVPHGPVFKLKPDLVVVSMSAINYGKRCLRGSPITVFKVTIKNIGPIAASGNSGRTRLRVYDKHYPFISRALFGVGSCLDRHR